MDNIMMFMISHVTRLWRHKIDTKGESQYGQVQFICTRNLKQFFREGILHLFFYLYTATFAYQFKTIEKNSKQFSDSSCIEIENE